MKLVEVYKCLCDETRLRLLNLLLDGPLCVCHLARILKVDQPKVSRHLKALRDAGMVETERCYNWTIYRMSASPGELLESNLRCLQDLRGEDAVFARDLKRRKKLLKRIRGGEECGVPDEICLLAGRAEES